MAKLKAMGLSSGCDASPGRPSRGSSSPLEVCWSGMPVADAIVGNSLLFSGLVVCRFMYIGK